MKDKFTEIILIVSYLGNHVDIVVPTRTQMRRRLIISSEPLPELRRQLWFQKSFDDGYRQKLSLGACVWYLNEI